jgi:hypothetical protein
MKTFNCEIAFDLGEEVYIKLNGMKGIVRCLEISTPFFILYHVLLPTMDIFPFNSSELLNKEEYNVYRILNNNEDFNNE